MDKQNKNTKTIHIDNLHLIKKMDSEYSEVFHKVYDYVIEERKKSDLDKNILINIALEQCLEGMEKKKKPSLIFPRDLKEFVSKYSKGPIYKDMKRKIRNQDYEKFTISSIWVVFLECMVLFFFKNLIVSEFSGDAHYLVNYWVDLGVASVAGLLVFQNYRVKHRIILRYGFGKFYFRMDLIALLLCVVVKLVVKSNVDITYLLLVAAFFVTKKKIKPQFEQVIE